MSKLIFDIVIPSWNMADYAVNCLQSIKAHSFGYRVIFVDNGSAPEQMEKVMHVLETMPHLLISNAENLGFIKATNQGILASEAPFVILMNNDTEAVPTWLQKLHRPLFIQPKVGLSGPLTTTPHSWQGKYPKGKQGYVIRTNGMLAFFCTMFKRGVFDKVGLLDENFGVGFGDDDDYCRRVLNAGYTMALVQDLVIPHHHRTTFKQLYNAGTINEMQRNAIDHYHEKHNIKKK
jgi:GT2 family glycosyltransferase